MDGILGWQILVVVSILIARVFSPRIMVGVALCWTAFTFIVVWAQWLVFLQLITAWATVIFATVVFRESIGDKNHRGIPRENDNKSEVGILNAGAVNNALPVSGNPEPLSKDSREVIRQLFGSIEKTAIKLESIEKTTIEQLLNEIHVPHLVHFTRADNLSNILSHGLMSLNLCKMSGISPMCNDAYRYDGQLNGISLSLGFPNYRMFWKYRQIMPEAEWAVLIISNKVLTLKDCAFYPHNAADARMIRQPIAQMKTATAFRDMFAFGDKTRDDWLKPYDPTDSQAEVLVYEAIEPNLIEAIAFETAEARARHLSITKGYESFYAGQGKGLFATRKQTRMN